MRCNLMINTNIAQPLFVVSVSIFFCLGILHGVLTLLDLIVPRTFTPPDQQLQQAMERSSIAINPQTNLWRAWLGFNLSHSLGLVIFGGAGITIGLLDFSIYARSILLQSCFLSIAIIYLILSIKFWFISPAIGSGIALAGLSIVSGLLMFT
jgi:hypothetical protein